MRFCEYPKGCNLPVFGTDKITRIGYCKTHQHLRTDLDKRSIAQRAMDKAKHKHPLVSDRLRSEVESNNAALNRWFVERRRFMTGICKHCGGKSCMEDDKYFKFSIAHILPKAYFPSVATHESNWIELCFWGNSCHTNFDNKVLDIIELNCFDEVIVKFQKIYPFIAAKEKKRIPEILLQYIGTDL